MMKSKGTVRVAAVGDIHIREHEEARARDLFDQIAEHADILALCGDVTNRGLPTEAQALGEAARHSRVPIVFVLGNHDHECGHVEEIERTLCQSGMHLLDHEPMEIGDVGFAGVKGFCGGFGQNTLAPFGEESVKKFVHETVEDALLLESGLAHLRTRHKIAILHYSPVRDTVMNEPLEIFPFLGSSRLAEPIDRYCPAAVFHGHAHNGTPEGKTLAGVPVYNVAMPLMVKATPDRPFFVLELPTNE